MNARPMAYVAGGALDDVDAVGLGWHATKLMVDNDIAEFFAPLRPRFRSNG